MTIHMQEAEAVRDFAKVMEHVAAGDEVQVDRADGERILIHLAKPVRPEPRHVDDVLARLRARAQEHGAVAMDADFAADVRHAHERLNEPMDGRKWD